jgi:hypothetical protein
METIEIFFNKELSDVAFNSENLQEWTEIAEELGMSNQLKLKKGTNSPIPYPFMNTSMQRVFETLCPRKVEFLEYDKTPIPLQVMKQIVFTKREQHFQKIEIWYDDKSPDPIVVGLTGKWGFYQDLKDDKGNKIYFDDYELAKVFGTENNTTPYFYGKDQYLIAKWGDEKKDFPQLKELARERFMQENSAQMEKDIKTLQHKLNTITENSYLYFGGSISLSEATTTSKW